MPLEWEELGGISPEQFTMRTAHSRLERVGDLWRDILDHKADLARAFGVS
jgi:DNA primase